MPNGAQNQNESNEESFDFAKMEAWTEDKTVSEFDTLPEWTPPPVGIYHFKLVRKGENTLVPLQFNDSGRPKYQARFDFEIIGGSDPSQIGEVVRQYYNITLNEKSNLRPIVEALNGRPLQPTDKMGWKDGVIQNQDGTTSQVIGIGGKCLTATLTHRKAESGKVYAKLMGPIPYAPQVTTAPAPTPPAAPPVAPALAPVQPDEEAGIDMDKVPF